MSDIFQNISEIIFLAGGRRFPPIGKGIGKPDILSCSEKSVAGFGVCRCSADVTAVRKRERRIMIFFLTYRNKSLFPVKFLQAFKKAHSVAQS